MSQSYFLLVAARSALEFPKVTNSVVELPMAQHSWQLYPQPWASVAVGLDNLNLWCADDEGIGGSLVEKAMVSFLHVVLATRSLLTDRCWVGVTPAG